MAVQLRRLAPFVWELARTGAMRVPGRVYADREGVTALQKEFAQRPAWSALQQVANVAQLPGIQRFSLALADVHVGYGAPIGGVAAMDWEEGVVTFGAVGFDINCGVNCLALPLQRDALTERDLDEAADALFEAVPAGLGRGGAIRLTRAQADEMMEKGAAFALALGYGVRRDLDYTELGGRAEGARVACVSEKARARMYKQLGTLGSGNHYLELQYVERVFWPEAAKAYGLREGQLVLFIHCGSRGLGHQIGADYLEKLAAATRRYGVKVAHQELVCAPIQSEEGQAYLGAMNAGVNAAFANRQVIGALARRALARALGVGENEARLVYGVGHNTAKKEVHRVEGEKRALLVHRKGSTRAFGPGFRELPAPYQRVGQPILVGGTMGTASYILAGTARAEEETFASGVHGAGRAKSRAEAKKQWSGPELVRALRAQGVRVRAHSWKGVAEEAPGAYKDIERVARVMDETGVNRKVARLRPLVVVKG